jgi:hypothetical protein
MMPMASICARTTALSMKSAPHFDLPKLKNRSGQFKRTMRCRNFNG